MKSLEKRERREIVVSQLVLGLGYVGDGPARTLLEALLDANDPLVRVLSLLSRSLDPEPRGVAAQASPRPVPRRRRPIPRSANATSRRHEPRPHERRQGRAHRAPRRRRPGSDAPPHRARGARGARATGVLFEVLLDLVFPDGKPAPVSPMSLTRDQRLVLRRLAEVTERSRGERDLSQRLVAKGLPADPRGLARFYALN
ncbi:MAG: hypothetical protein U0235_15265 [Polyangiaceae bacterium]